MLDEYVGIPYTFAGRDREGVDCYGLVWLMELEVWGKQLPSLTDMEDGNRAEIFQANRPLIEGQQIDIPENGDIVLLFLRNTPQHVGVYYDGGVFHATETRGSVYEKLNSRFMQRFNKKEFYRV